MPEETPKTYLTEDRGGRGSKEQVKSDNRSGFLREGRVGEGVEQAGELRTLNLA